MLASVAAQASLSLTWSETLENTFSHDEAHIVLFNLISIPIQLCASFVHCLFFLIL